MNKSSKFLTAAGIVALGLAANVGEAEAKGAKEKCYGIAKAGKNDCGASDKSHSCAAQAKEDGMGTEWVYVLKGSCDKIVGGSTEPKS